MSSVSTCRCGTVHHHGEIGCGYCWWSQVGQFEEMCSERYEEVDEMELGKPDYWEVLKSAIKQVQEGLVDKVGLYDGRTQVYSCGNVVRVDIKKEV